MKGAERVGGSQRLCTLKIELPEEKEEEYRSRWAKGPHQLARRAGWLLMPPEALGPIFNSGQTEEEHLD